MAGFSQNATDKNLRARLSAGSGSRGVGDGLTFVAEEARAREGKASWILRHRYAGRQREKVVGRYPDISLKDAHELARKDRALLQQRKDVGAIKRREKLEAIDMHDFAGTALADAKAFKDWLAPQRKCECECEWVVYAKRPFARPQAVQAYLSRYTHRVAISNNYKLSPHAGSR